MTIRQTASATLGLLAGLTGAAAPAAAEPGHAPAAQAGPNPRFGLVHVDGLDLHAVRFPDKPPADREALPPDVVADRYRRAAESGAGWNRWSLYWDLVERAGQMSWAASDGIVARDVAHGLRTLAVLQGNQPGVAVMDGAPEGLDAGIFTTAGGALTDDPAQAAAVNPANRWAAFVDAVVERYRPGGGLAQARGWGAGAGIGAWEIGNEPNLRAFWRGTPAEYARYLEVAYLVIERRDPEAVVMHGGIADDAGAQAWYGQLLDALKARAAASPLPARHGYYFDKAAWHWYRSPSLLETGPDRARALLAERGIPAKPIWVTEAGLPIWAEHPGPCWDPASPGRADLAEQAGYIWQALPEALAAGVETLFYFQLYDDCGNGPTSYDAFGLVRNHAGNQCWAPFDRPCWQMDPKVAGTPRPAYAAFQVAARELRGARLVRQTPAAAGGRRIVFARPDARVTVAWSAAGAQSVAVDAAAASATLHTIDPAGAVTSRTLAAAGGRYTVGLAAPSNHNGIGGRPIVAGLPVILVERGAGGVRVDAGAAAAPGVAGPSSAGAAAIARDVTPPVLAVVAPLPATSPRRLDLTVVAGDDGSGLDAFLVYAARGPGLPRLAEDWTVVGTVRPWPADRRAGQARVAFEGKPGETWYFTAQAGDRAGNWTALPAGAQATTRIAGAVRGGGSPARARPR